MDAKPAGQSSRRNITLALVGIFAAIVVAGAYLATSSHMITFPSVVTQPARADVCGSWDTKLAPPSPDQSQVLNPAHKVGAFYALAVVATDDAWGVGRIDNEAFVKHWDGTAWQSSAAPNPSGSVGTNINAISVIASNDIWAVGSYFREPSFANEWTIIMHYDGNAWTIIPSPNPGPERNTLRAVAAHAADDVWAVGDYQIADAEWRALVVHWDGQHWTQLDMPFFATGGDYETFSNTLSDVVVIAADDVWVVGDYSDKKKSNGYYYGGGLAMHWDGRQWTNTPVPRGPDRGDSGLTAVSAVGANEVWAVGSGWYRQARLLRWDGQQWSTVASPFGEEYEHPLMDVLALAADDVWALGSTGSNPHRTALLHWDGMRWGVVDSPSPLLNSDFVSIASAVPQQIWALGAVTANNFEPHTLGPPTYPFVATFTPSNCLTPTAH